jgi:hypothetical protein
LTIYTRLFKINPHEDILNTWKDIKSGDLKAIADIVKKYNLYPFENLEYFGPGKLVTREKAFESLKRFLDFKEDFSLHSSANIVAPDPKSDLEQAMAELFQF